MNRVPGRVKLARALRAAGPRGVHTLTVREELRLGNPSERRADLERRGFLITSKVEKRHGRHGSRFVMVRDAGDSMAWLTDHELDAEIGGGSAARPTHSGAPSGRDAFGSQPAPAAADLSAESTPAPPLPSRGAPTLAWFRDYTEPESEWERVPYDLEEWGPPKVAA